MQEERHSGRHAVIIGAGIVGACIAQRMTSQGWRVTVIEPGAPGGPQAASYGNGAFISPASIIPMSVPGLWRKVPGYLLDTTGPLTIRWASMPRLTPWLSRFLLAGATEARLRRTVSQLDLLLRDGPARHRALADSIGLPGMIVESGLLYAYPDRAAFAAEAPFWALRREAGLTWQELDTPALRAAEPALSDRYTFGLLLAGGSQCTDPGGYAAAILRASGAELRRSRATGFVRGPEGITAVETADGPVACDIAILAAGMGAARLAALAGDRVPLEAERGYHVEISDPPIRLTRPVMPSDGKMANVMTAGGLRAAGQVELSRAEAEPDWRRADILLQHVSRTYPALQGISRDAVRLWQGNRPSTPDGLPVIGPARIPGLWHAFGHGHVGLNAAPATADLLLAMIDGQPLPFDATPFSARRFS